jgi:hypothetical protein
MRTLLETFDQLAPTHALVDAARCDRILPLLSRQQFDYVSLYDGYSAQSLAAYAPYLVTLPKKEDHLRQLLKAGWGDSWGIYLFCTEPVDILRRHLRHFLMILDEQGQQVYFRYYDPRVLRRFLPSCQLEETHRFFGPIQRFYLEGDTACDLLVFTVDQSGLKKLSTRVQVTESN